MFVLFVDVTPLVMLTLVLTLVPGMTDVIFVCPND